jgi:DNA-binding MarR family transcriptional regulator
MNRGADPLTDFNLSYYLPYLFKHIGSQMEAATAGGLAGFAVNIAVFRILAVLFQHGDVSHTELARLTSIEVSTLSRISDGVERQGLIRRVRACEDQRVKRVTLTAEGRNLIENIIPAALHNENEMFTKLSTRDRNRLIELLHKVVASLNKYSAAELDVDRSCPADGPQRSKRATAIRVARQA